MKTLALLLSATAVGTPLALARGGGDECQETKSTCESAEAAPAQECQEAAPSEEASWLADLAAVLEDQDTAAAQAAECARAQACDAAAAAAQECDARDECDARASADAAVARRDAEAAARADWRLAAAARPAQDGGERAHLEARLHELEAMLAELNEELAERRGDAPAPPATSGRAWFTTEGEGDAFFSDEENGRVFALGMAGEEGEHAFPFVIDGEDGARELLFSDEDGEHANVFTTEGEDGPSVWFSDGGEGHALHFTHADGEPHGVIVIDRESGRVIEDHLARRDGDDHEHDGDHDEHARTFTLDGRGGGHVVFSTNGNTQTYSIGEGEDGHAYEVRVGGDGPHGIAVAPRAPHAPHAPHSQGGQPAPPAAAGPAPNVWFAAPGRAGQGSGGAVRGFTFRSGEDAAPRAELDELTELLRAMRADMRELREEMRGLREDVARLRKGGSGR